MQNTPAENTKFPEEPALEEARRWVERSAAAWWGAETPYEYLRSLFLIDWSHHQREFTYVVNRDALDPLVPDIKGFFSDVSSWITRGWALLPAGFASIYAYLEGLWNNLTAGLSDLATKIKDEIVGLANFISNIYTWVVWNLVDDLRTFVTNFFRPLTDAWDTVTDTLSSSLNYIWEAITNFLQAPIQWILDLAADLWASLTAVKDMIWDSLVSAADIVGGYLGSKLTAFAPVLVEYLRDALLWLWDAIKTGFLFVVEDVVPAAYGATSGALGWLKDEFTNLVGLAYDEIVGKATALVPVTPERSAGIAAGMFGSAVGFGVLAHSMALAVEAVPNLKYMGVHYLSAFTAHMGGFGLISSATMGVIAALAVREPFGYYMKSILRPTQPREMDLQIMAVKPDITIETFRQGMKYMGYSDFWIDAFQRTMYREPRYFELSMMGEDEAATSEWLFTKARRAGYTETDSGIFVSSLLKKVTRDQRKELFKQATYAFKEGYISEGQFKGYLDDLEMRPEAKEFAVRAANLAYQADLYKELIATYRKAFQEDLITEGEFRTSLAALGMPEERVSSTVELEWVKKQPKILKAERKEIETEWREIQGDYSRLYIESFRRGLISEAQLAAYLVAIGFNDRAARATARYEAIKLVPKVKPVEILIPLIPAPPSPPELA